MYSVILLVSDVKNVARNLRAQFIQYQRKFKKAVPTKSGQGAVIQKQNERPKWKFYDQMEEIFDSFNAIGDREGVDTLNLQQILLPEKSQTGENNEREVRVNYENAIEDNNNFDEESIESGLNVDVSNSELQEIFPHLKSPALDEPYQRYYEPCLDDLMEAEYNLQEELLTPPPTPLQPSGPMPRCVTERARPYLFVSCTS